MILPGRRLIRIVCALLAITGSGTFGWKAWRQSAERTPTELRAGYLSFAPFLIPGPDETVDGIAVEIVNRAAQQANIRLRWVRVTNPDQALRDGAIDFFPLLTLTPKRRKEFHFSDPWWQSESALVSLRGNPLRPGSRTPGEIIATRGQAPAKMLAQAIFPQTELVTITVVDDMMAALCAGKVRALLLDVMLLEAELLSGSMRCAGQPLHVAYVPGGSLPLGTASRKPATAAVDRLSTRIAELALDGTLATAALEWSPISSFQSTRMKETQDEKQRTVMLRYGLGILTLILAFTWLQAVRMRRSRARLAWQAQHDTLTGLPNRRLFEQKLAECVEEARSKDCGLAVLFFDCDGFKRINDTLGHAFGDEVLKAMVHRLQTGLKSRDILARMGGDEFIVIAPGICDEAGAGAMANRLLGTLSTGLVIDGHELVLTASAGISVFHGGATTGNSLLQEADAAMYEAKRDGKNRVCFFRPAMNAAIHARLDLEGYLRQALAKGEITVHYQPEIVVGTGAVARYEALLRWTHPVLGEIPPSTFITIAEETGLIIPLGAFVLAEACRYGKRLMESGSEAGVAVNVSNVQFCRPDFVPMVIATLDRSGMPPNRLDLELTESLLMRAIEDARMKIAALRNLGITISIDDFGTGYSSLSYLRTLQADNLKIDRSFVRDIEFDRQSYFLIQGLVSLARSIGMKVVVEGIEDNQQLAAVRELGCDVVQGYLLGRPAPAPAVLANVAELQIA